MRPAGRVAPAVRPDVIRLLVVEDDPRVALHLRRILEQPRPDRACTMVAHEATEAGALVRLQYVFGDDRGWDCVITDLHLGADGGEGLAIAEACRTLGLPVVICTGSPDDVRGYETGHGVPIIDKVYMRRDLPAAVERAIARAEAL